MYQVGTTWRDHLHVMRLLIRRYDGKKEAAPIAQR